MAAINSLRALKAEKPDPVSKGDGFAVAPHLLVEEEGFNVRGAFDPGYFDRSEVVAHIRSLADSYKAGRYVPPIVVQTRDGVPYVRDGHCRRRGLMLAISEGAQIQKIQVLEHKGDEADQAALIVSSNNSLPLSIMERAVIYGRLANWGFKDHEIAAKVGGISAERVRQLRGYLELPLELKRMIDADHIAAGYAAELYAEHGQKAIEIAKAAKEEADKAGKTKVTKSIVTKAGVSPTPRAPRFSKKLLASMREGVSTLTRHLDNLNLAEDRQTFTVKLTVEDVELLQALKEQMDNLKPAAEATEATKKAGKEQQALPL